MKRAIGLLVLIMAVTVFGAYVSSVRANGQQTPCDGGDGANGTPWKWGFCHQGHAICVGDQSEPGDGAGPGNNTGHTIHGVSNDSNPPLLCFFAGCCQSANDIADKCKEDTSSPK